MAAEPTPRTTHLVLTAVLAAATGWAALTAWTPFVAAPSTFLPRLAVVAVVIAATGAGLRLARLPAIAVVGIQTVTVLVVVTLQITGSPVAFGDLAATLGTSVDSARTYAAPIGRAAPPVWPLLVVSGAAALLAIDIVAGTLRRAGGAGLVLLAVYAVPSGLTTEGGGIASFVAAALGFAGLLYLDHLVGGDRWGRRVATSSTAQRRFERYISDSALRSAVAIAVTATTVAVAVPAVLPDSGLQVFDVGPGQGNDDIRIRKPVADMRRDLQRGADVPLIRLRTDDPEPSYLRISVLNRYTGQEWSSGDRDVSSDDRADGPLSPPDGLSPQVPRSTYSYEVTATRRFDSTWLPTMYPATAVDAPGDWRFDPRTLDILAADDDLDTRGIRYTMTAEAPDYGTDGRFFEDASSGATDAEVRALPEIPDLVRSLARSVTARGTTDYERAVLLQRWFRTDGGFRYDLASSPEGMGNDTLQSFLSPSGRVGYCEQYASAMAVMARVVGIPSRIAVGLLRPDELPDGSWEYSSHDLHAWPELYFAGAGWVRFEPTPADRSAAAPDYSRGPVGGEDDAPIEEPSQAPSSAQPSEQPSAAPSQAPEQGAAADTDEGGGVGGVLLIALLVALGLALLLVALALPRSLRAASRRTRRESDVEGLWAELRATVLDLGLAWPEDRSPADTGEALVALLADPAAAPDPETGRRPTGGDAAPDAATALDRLVAALERARYARPTPVGGGTATMTGADIATLRSHLDVVLAALEAGVAAGDRRRAAWLPRSLWRRDRD